MTPILLITLISSLGMLLILKKSIPHMLLSVLIALGAGSMLAVSILHILPEAMHHASYGALAFL